MLRLRMGALLLLILGTAAWAADDPKDKPKSPDGDVKSLMKEFNDKQQEYIKATRAATTNEERTAARKLMPNVQEYAKNMLALAEKNPKDPGAVDALIWVAQRVSYLPEGKKAIEQLVAEHLDSDKIGAIVPALARTANGDESLRKILAKAKQGNVKGQATFALAQALVSKANRGADVNVADKLNKEAETLLEEVVAKYADIKAGRGTLGQSAEGMLYEVRHLSVGKEVPDIEAEDTDGKKFKLSEYRGKVVMIDFWGHW